MTMTIEDNALALVAALLAEREELRAQIVRAEGETRAANAEAARIHGLLEDRDYGAAKAAAWFASSAQRDAFDEDLVRKGRDDVRAEVGALFSHREVAERALDAYGRHNKITAIKSVRTLTGLGLKEAKDLVEVVAGETLGGQPLGTR